jgi:hypothetical protein
VPTSFRIALCLLLLAGRAVAQAPAPDPVPRTDLAVTFLGERSLKAATSVNFWMEGGSVEAGFAVTRSLNIAADYTATHTGSIGSSGVPLTLSVLAAGPRYRWNASHPVSAYGEVLLGFAHGSDSAFPAPAGAVPTANSFALQLGGGLDCRLSQHFAVRVLDLGYVRTTLPNGTDNQQNTLRLGAGVVYRFGW